MSGRPIPYRQLLAMAEHATGFDIPVPGVAGEVVKVRPAVEMRSWVVFRGHMFGREYLTAAGWEATDESPTEPFTWPLPQALQRAQAAAEEQGAEHAAWLAARTEQAGAGHDEHLLTEGVAA